MLKPSGPLCVAGASILFGLCVSAGGGSAESDIAPHLQALGVTLEVTRRPEWPGPPDSRVEVKLAPQVDTVGSVLVSFGLPFGPGWLSDDNQLRVLNADGAEIPAFARPLAWWWIDGKQGTVRSVLVQFEFECRERKPQSVTIAWDRPRTKTRSAEVPVAQTQVAMKVNPPPEYAKYADSFEYRCPNVLAVLPARWLCDSLLVWQQVPASENRSAPWFDEHLVAKFDRSTWNISANAKKYEAHLFDRPATYAKIYARYGEAKYLLAMLKALDFYLQHLGDDGYLDLKRYKDVKYVYTEGAAIAYLLTGDERFRAGIARALKAWERYKTIEYTRRSKFFTERHHGFGMVAYLHAYEITGRAEYLRKAVRFFDAAYANHDAEYLDVRTLKQLAEQGVSR